MTVGNGYRRGDNSGGVARGSGAVVDDVFEVLESQELLTCDVAWLVK